MPLIRSDNSVPVPALFKRFALIYLAIVMFFSIVLLSSIRLDEQGRLERIEMRETSRIEIAKGLVMQDMSTVETNLRLIANMPMLRGYLDSDNPAQREELEKFFLFLSREMRHYDQVRYLDASGQEVIRINYNDGKPVIVPREQLQNKAGRYYFDDTLKLKQGEVFVSPLDLNIEHGSLEIPHKPMIRFGTPVFDSAGRKKGIIMLNYLGNELLQHFREVMRGGDPRNGMLLNRDGYWLSSIKHEDEWGFMLGKNERTFGRDFAEEWRAISAAERGTLRTDRGLFAYATVYPLLSEQRSSTGAALAQAHSQQELMAHEYRWKIVSFVSNDVLSGAAFYSQTSNRILLLFVYLLLALAAWTVAYDTLSRKQARIDLAKSKARYDELAQRISVGVYLLHFHADGSMRFEYVSPVFCQILGLDADAVLRDANIAFAAAHPDDLDSLIRSNQEAAMSLKPFRWEGRFITRGETRWVRIESDPTPQPGGGSLWSGVVSDITERKKSEEDFANISRLSQAIVDGADHLIITTDTQGVILSFNRAAEASLGYSAEELVGKLTPAVFHDPDEVVRRAQELTAAGLPVEPGFEVFVARSRTQRRGDAHEWTYVRKDGTRFPVSLTVSALRDTNGDIYAFLGIATDISERSRAAQVQHENEARLAAILDNVLDGIITINEQGTVESFNKSAEEIFGYAAADVIVNNVRMLMPEPYHSEHDGYLNNYIFTGKKKIIGIGRQVVGKRKDGSTFPMDLAVSEMQLGSKRMFTGIVRDITERVKIERMKSEFISTVSHELRTPLTSIRGALGLIAGGVGGALPTQVKTLVEIAHKNSERLILLVNDILDMEKIEAGKMEFQSSPTELISLLKQALEGNHTYAEQFNVTYELESELPEVMVNVDANRLMQVLANLLSNAAKFSPSGDKVVITATSNGKRVRVVVSDHGSGIPEQFRSQIFQKFAQADASDTRKKGGTGLGLSITKSIVEQMGGSIGFDSQPDVLTTFFIEFPIWQEAAVVASDSMEAGKMKRVLICEDDHDIAALLRMMLEQAGLATDIAYNAAQAKQMLAQRSYAAMTLDLALPDQDGITLIRELRTNAATAALPIVVVSASAIEGRKELNGEAFNVIDWIRKPINKEQLVAALQQAVGRASDARPKVLHVEDDPDVFRVVNAIVGEFAELDNATNLADARRMLDNNHYDLAILDISLPDGSGMELLPTLNGATPPIPVMVFSAHDLALEDVREVKSALVKSRTDNAQLLATIKRLIGAE